MYMIFAFEGHGNTNTYGPVRMYASRAYQQRTNLHKHFTFDQQLSPLFRDRDKA